MLKKFRSIFIVLVFEFIGNVSLLYKYILWLKVVLLLVLSYIVQLVRAMVTLVFVLAHFNNLPSCAKRS